MSGSKSGFTSPRTVPLRVETDFFAGAFSFATSGKMDDWADDLAGDLGFVTFDSRARRFRFLFRSRLFFLRTKRRLIFCLISSF